MIGGGSSRLFVDPAEERLRAGWRLGVWLFVVTLAATLGLVGGRLLVDVAPARHPAAIAAVAGGVLLYAVVIAAGLAVAVGVDRRSLADLGLGGSAFGRHLALGAILGVAMTTTVFLVELALGAVRVVGVLVTDSTASVVPGAAVGAPAVGDLDPLVVIVLLVPFYVAVGVAEEVLVRGYLLTNVAEGIAGVGPITDRLAVGVAVLATGGLFGALHLANPSASLRSAALITAVGVLLGWTYAASGDLGVPIGIHVTWNFTLATLYGFPVSGLAPPASVLATTVTGDPLLTGGAFGPEAGLVIVAPLVLAVGVTAWWLRRTMRSSRLRPDIARYDPTAGDRY